MSGDVVVADVVVECVVCSHSFGVGDGMCPSNSLDVRVCDGVPTISLIVYYRSGVTPPPSSGKVAKWQMKV